MSYLIITIFVCITAFMIYLGIKPIYLPFHAFKMLCAIGKKASISQNIEYFQHNFKYQYTDQRYNKWRNELKARNALTQSEDFALQRQTLKEINAEIKKRGI